MYIILLGSIEREREKGVMNPKFKLHYRGTITTPKNAIYHVSLLAFILKHDRTSNSVQLRDYHGVHVQAAWYHYLSTDVQGIGRGL